MLHTIQADFYRLFRSKGFWITEAILVLNILSGVIFGATGHVGVNTESKLPQATEVWTGFKSLDQLLFQHQCDYPLYHYCHHLGPGNRLNAKLIQE